MSLYTPARPWDDEAQLELPVLQHLLKAEGYALGTTPVERLVDELEPGPITADKLGALSAAHGSNLCWTHWPTFEKWCAVNAHQVVDFRYMQPPAMDEVSVAILCLGNVKAQPLSDEVLNYCAVAAAHDGFWYLPSFMAEVRPFLRQNLKDRGLSRLPVEEVRVLLDQGPVDEPQTLAHYQANKIFDLMDVAQSWSRRCEQQLETYGA